MENVKLLKQLHNWNGKWQKLMLLLPDQCDKLIRQYLFIKVYGAN